MSTQDNWNDTLDPRVAEALYADREETYPVAVQQPAEPSPVPSGPPPRYERRMPSIFTVLYGLAIISAGVVATGLAAWGWPFDARVAAPVGLAGFGLVLVLAAIVGLIRRR